MNKPKVKLSGTDENVFALAGKCASALKKHNMYKEAQEMNEKIFASHSYDEALQVMMNYVDVS